MKICQGVNRYLLVVNTQPARLVVVDLLSIEEKGNEFVTFEVDLNQGSTNSA